MTPTPLPPLPHKTEDPFRFYTADQMQAYARQARADLEAENQRLREKLAALRKEALEPPTNKTHRCIKCLHAYRPDNGESEDCPACGHDGAALEKQP